MKRRIALLLAGAVVASLAVFAPVSRAAANSLDVCVGRGTATTGPLFYPTTTSPATVGFTIQFTVDGVCAVKTILTAAGTLTGWCDHSVARGTTNNNHDFVWVSAGSLLVLTGGVTGLANAIPNPLTSCLTGATRFIVTSAVVKSFNCQSANKIKTTTTVNGLPYTVKVCTG